MRIEDLVDGERYYTCLGNIDGTRGLHTLIEWKADDGVFHDLDWGEVLEPEQVKVIARMPEMLPFDPSPMQGGIDGR